jgi:parallel beta-helix repeat protein
LVTAAPAGALSVVYVAPSGSGGGSCATPDFNTISAAVTAASGGETINVCAGTYNEMVIVSAVPVTLNAVTAPVIVNATGQPEGIVIKGATAAGTVVQGFSVNNAQGEGILVEGTSNVTVQNNIVSGNDLACIPQTGANDCGEGIHLEAVTNSTVSRNTSESNSGGILLDDGVPPNTIGAGAFGGPTAYYGPTSGNMVLNNIVVNNIWDCGITMPSHNSLAAPGGHPNPAAGGIFDNTVQGNVSQNNGTAGGGGSGILMAAPFPGAAAYDNTITGNTVSGNGQAGITIHSHAPAQDVNGNVITKNTVGQNAVGESQPGTGVFTTGSTSAGDVDAGDPATTGIVVFSAADHVTGTVLTGNSISNNYYGIWTANTDTSGISNNTFTNVTVPVYTVPPPGSGYLMAGSDGGAFNFGQVGFWGSAAGSSVTAGSGVVGLAATPDSGGYWMATAAGGIAAFGDAANLGSMANAKLNAPVVGIAATADGHGYWMVASDGGIFSFGDATFMGSMGGKPLNKPIVGIAATPDAGGYWEVASDGGIFSFGDATFYGSTGSLHLNKPVVGMAVAPNGTGYWLVASDGGIFSYGTAVFHGSTGSLTLNKPVIGLTAMPDGGGYWLIASDGGVFNYGDAAFMGSLGSLKLVAPIVATTGQLPFNASSGG